jgi:large subunit ribosomal protein L33
MREIITLACGACKRRNYSTTKNRRKSSERLEFSKYCRYCRKHTAHKESKEPRWTSETRNLPS